MTNEEALLVGLGFVLGVVVTAGFFLVFYSDNPRVSSAGRALAERIESFPVESVCTALTTGKQPLGKDHITVWREKRSYVVAGWTVDGAGVPVCYWTGAGLPDDVEQCRPLLR